MSSALSSRSESSSRNWWQRKGYVDKPGSGKQSTGILSAIGLKTKKPSSLAIQDPPTLLPPLSPKYPNRPPSKSVSSTRSRVDSLEPRTPVDAHHRDPIANRQSLLTLSDADPFAARGITSLHSPLEPNRLSAYSNSSDYLSKDMSHRGSITSSSSNSHADISPSSETVQSRFLSPKKSTSSLHRKASVASPESEMVHAWESLSHTNSKPFMKSSSTLTDKNRLSQPERVPHPRPPMRARGLTESGGTSQPPFLRDDRPYPVSSPNLSSPRVVIRQASVSRAVLPPSAPPSHDLPPPPSSESASATPDDVELSGGSTSSSSVSFFSHREMAMANQHYTPRPKDPKPLNCNLFTRKLESEPEVKASNPPPPRTLKKALSHQSLAKRVNSPATSTPTTPLRETPPVEKAPRKQRSFHHPRIPLPSSSSRTLHSSMPSSTSPSYEEVLTPDSRRGSANGPSTPVRKRLFSGSSMRRPSTSQSTPTEYEEDARSVFSLPIESTPHSSFSNWGGGSPRMTSESPPVQQPAQDYIPQHILSPEDMLKIEAELQQERLTGKARARGMSVLSSSTMASSTDWDISDAAAAHRDIISGMPKTPASGLVSRNSHSRPSTAQGPGPITLAPPPRSWSQRTLSAPPTPDEITGIIPLSPPPRKNVRKKASMDSTLHPPQPKPPPPSLNDKYKRRRSLMRKPSFLDIGNDDDDDDDDDEAGEQTDTDDRQGNERRQQQVPPSKDLGQSSFLDLARESFDTVRSD